MRAAAAVCGALAALAALCPPGGSAAQDPPALSEAEIRALLAHGPWPAPLVTDPGNRVSGKRAAVEFGWDGATDKLWAQSIRPILDARELGAGARHVADLMRRDEQLSCRYSKVFGAAPSATDDAVRHYSERGSRELKGLKLTAGEQSDLVVFLESLSTFSNPWRPDDLNRCH